MEPVDLQLERWQHRALAGLLAAAFLALGGGFVAVGAFFSTGVAATATFDDAQLGALSTLAPLFLGLVFAMGCLWVVLGGLRDLCFGYVLRIEDGVLSYPHRLGRRRHRLADVKALRRAPGGKDLQVVLHDGRTYDLGSTGALRAEDLDRAIDTVNGLLA